MGFRGKPEIRDKKPSKDVDPALHPETLSGVGLRDSASKKGS